MPWQPANGLRHRLRSHPTTPCVVFGPSLRIRAGNGRPGPESRPRHAANEGSDLHRDLVCPGHPPGPDFGVKTTRMNFRICRMSFRMNFLRNAPQPAENSRAKFTRRIGALMRPIFDHLLALLFGLSWQVALVSHVKSKSTPLPRHAPNGPQLDTRHPADW